MSTMNLPLEIYDMLERKLGRDDAMTVAKSIQDSLGHMEQRGLEISFQRKTEAKEELKHELRDELATKADIEALRGGMKVEIQAFRTDMAKLDKKFSMMFLSLAFLIVLMNRDALTLLGQMLHLVR
jgi:hypothetical protein